MILDINNFNIMPFVAYGGLNWSRNDVDGSNAGRSLENAILYRDRLAQKTRLDVTLIPLETAQLRKILQVIKPEFVTVRYDDLQDGIVVKQMYSNNVPASFQIVRRGKDYWGGVTFPLIER